MDSRQRLSGASLCVATMFLLAGCGSASENTTSQSTANVPVIADSILGKPLVSHIYTADPSAHVFDGTIYIYPSHDVEAQIAENDMGDHFDMRDYHVLSINQEGSGVTDHGVALDVKDVPWAERQMWAPDAAHKDGTYYLYFPAKDKDGVFRIGVATSSSPTGPFKAEANAIEGSYSIDPSVFKDDDGSYYMYFGGIWGGQLQRWASGSYEPNGSKTDLQKDDQPAIAPRVAKLDSNMKAFAEPVKEVQIVDENGKPILGGDHDRRFFEAAWMHKHNGKYYFSYSTGDTHYIAYAIGDSPYGPFTYQGVILNPVSGWTNHHSTVKVGDQWYLFYHDVELSGKTPLRNIKVTKLEHGPDGKIKTIDPGNNTSTPAQ